MMRHARLRSKTTVESPNLGSDVAESTHERRVSAMVEQIENLMNSSVQ